MAVASFTAAANDAPRSDQIRAYARFLAEVEAVGGPIREDIVKDYTAKFLDEKAGPSFMMVHAYMALVMIQAIINHATIVNATFKRLSDLMETETQKAGGVLAIDDLSLRENHNYLMQDSLVDIAKWDGWAMQAQKILITHCDALGIKLIVPHAKTVKAASGSSIQIKKKM